MTDFDAMIPESARTAQWVPISTSTKYRCCRCFNFITGKIFMHGTAKPRQYMDRKCMEAHNEHCAAPALQPATTQNAASNEGENPQ